MRGSLGQFVFWFMISFSPAPFVGFGTYAIVHGQDAAPAAETPAPRMQYGAPIDREFSDAPPPAQEVGLPPEQPPLEPQVEPVDETPVAAPQRRARQIDETPKTRRTREKPDL